MEGLGLGAYVAQLHLLIKLSLVCAIGSFIKALLKVESPRGQQSRSELRVQHSLQL